MLPLQLHAIPVYATGGWPEDPYFAM